MRLDRRKLRVLSVVVFASIVVVLLIPEVSLGHSSRNHCPSSRFCYWENENFGGCFSNENASDNDLTNDLSEPIASHDSCGFYWSDDIDSAYNRETVCVYMYAEVGYQGQVEPGAPRNPNSYDSDTEIHDGISSILYGGTGSCG